MEWFWATVAYMCFAAIGGLGAFVMYYWFALARSKTAPARMNTRARGRP